MRSAIAIGGWLVIVWELDLKCYNILAARKGSYLIGKNIKMESSKERPQPRHSLEASKSQNNFEEKRRIGNLVSRALPLVNWEAKLVADSVWRAPSYFAELKRGKIIIEDRDKIIDIFGRESAEYLGLFLHDYASEREFVVINIETFNEATSYLAEAIRKLELKTPVEIEFLLAFSVLSHEGIVHRWCLDRELTDGRLRNLIKKFAKKSLERKIGESNLDTERDDVRIYTHGCYLDLRKADWEKSLEIGRELDEGFAQLFTYDLVYAFLKDYYGLNGDESAEVTFFISLLWGPKVNFSDHLKFKTKIGKSKLANQYFGSNFYSGLDSRLTDEEINGLLTNLHKGDIEAFTNVYFKNYAGCQINQNLELPKRKPAQSLLESI